MPSVMSTLHDVAATGSVERLLNLLSGEPIDINAGCDDHGWSALMIAAEEGYLRIVRVLLRRGASVAVSTEGGHTALHIAVHNKHLAVSKALVKAGAGLEGRATCFTPESVPIKGHTPLHLAAGEGFVQGIIVLLDAGAEVDSRLDNGATPLYLSACCGHLEAVKILLNANADPCLCVDTNLPLEVAAQEGHSEVIKEFVRKVGVDGCSRDGGIETLETAAYGNHLTIVAFLCDEGVVDMDGTAFCAAVEGRAVECIKFLLHRRGGHADISIGAYINIAKGLDSPLLCTFNTGSYFAPKITQFLIEQGADTVSKVWFHINRLGVVTDTPVDAANLALKHAEGFVGVDDSGVDGLKGVIRVLRQAKAVNAVSWAWPNNTKRKMPVAKKKAPRPTMLLAAMARCVRSAVA